MVHIIQSTVCCLLPMNTLVKEDSAIKYVNFYFLPFIIECLSRWLGLGIYRNLEAKGDPNSFYFFAIINILITLFTVSFVYIHYNGIRKKYTFIAERNYESKVTLFSIIFIVFVILSVNYIVYDVFSKQSWYISFSAREGAQAVIPTVTFLGYGTFILLLSLLCMSVPRELKKEASDTGKTSLLDDIEDLIQGEKTFEVEDLKPIDEHDYDIDRNDVEIVKLEGALKNEQTRIDAYILESVLFGALAFSAFITIIASERFNFTQQEYTNLRKESVVFYTQDSLSRVQDAKVIGILPIAFSGDTKEHIDAGNKVSHIAVESTFIESEVKLFWQNITTLLDSVLLFNFSLASEAWSRIQNPRQLLILIMFETLFCSLFFLSVIAARLRYSIIAEEIDNLIRLARTFNDKEEEVYNLNLQIDEHNQVKSNLLRRLTALEKAINLRIERAKALRQQTKPIIFYMSLLRNMGVFMFIIILINSSMFFSNTLASIFISLSLFAYAYESIDGWLRKRRISRANFPSITTK